MFLKIIYQDLLVRTRNAEQLMQENDTEELHLVVYMTYMSNFSGPEETNDNCRKTDITGTMDRGFHCVCCY
jgi:hypothetical protein